MRISWSREPSSGMSLAAKSAFYNIISCMTKYWHISFSAREKISGGSRGGLADRDPDVGVGTLRSGAPPNARERVDLHEAPIRLAFTPKKDIQRGSEPRGAKGELRPPASNGPVRRNVFRWGRVPNPRDARATKCRRRAVPRHAQHRRGRRGPSPCSVGSAGHARRPGRPPTPRALRTLRCRRRRYLRGRWMCQRGALREFLWE